MLHTIDSNNNNIQDNNKEETHPIVSNLPTVMFSWSLKDIVAFHIKNTYKGQRTAFKDDMDYGFFIAGNLTYQYGKDKVEEAFMDVIRETYGLNEIDFSVDNDENENDTKMLMSILECMPK